MTTKNKIMRGLVLLVFSFSFFTFSYANETDNLTEELSFIGDDNTSLEEEFTINLGNETYNEIMIVEAVDSRIWIQEYIKSFGYECVYVETDAGQNFTVVFDPVEGRVLNLTGEKICDREVFIEESLIDDLKENGFEKGKINQYLEKTELSLKMHFDVLRVLIFN